MAAPAFAQSSIAPFCQVAGEAEVAVADAGGDDHVVSADRECLDQVAGSDEVGQSWLP